MRIATIAFVICCAACHSAEDSAPDAGGPVACPQFVTELRDPATGNCLEAGGCDIAKYKGYPSCVGSCTGLSASQCVATSGCIVASFTTGQFFGCWQTSVPAEAGSCAGLDDIDCLAHDHCTAIYTPDGAFGQFARCADKAAAFTR